MFLLDVNLLVALAWHRHASHDRVHHWFTRHRANGWATCPITQCGLLRLSCNPLVSGIPCTPEQAAVILRGVTAEPGHVFWPDDLPPADMPTAGLRGHRQITDAYLLALARHHGGRLATLDAAAASLPGGVGAVEVIA